MGDNPGRTSPGFLNMKDFPIFGRLFSGIETIKSIADIKNIIVILQFFLIRRINCETVEKP